MRLLMILVFLSSYGCVTQVDPPESYDASLFEGEWSGAFQRYEYGCEGPNRGVTGTMEVTITKTGDGSSFAISGSGAFCTTVWVLVSPTEAEMLPTSCTYDGEAIVYQGGSIVFHNGTLFIDGQTMSRGCDTVEVSASLYRE